MINLRDFVDVTITRITPVNRLQHDTVVMINAQATPGYYSINGTTTGDGTKTKPKPLSALTYFDTTENFMTTFTANGGKSIHAVSGVKITNGIWTADSNAEIPMEEVIIYGSYNDLKDVTANGTGIQQKLLVTTKNDSWKNPDIGWLALCDNEYVAGVMCAYLTNLDFTKADIAKDFTFTVANGFANVTASYIATSAPTDNTTVVAYLAGDYRALGGDDSKGQSVTNDFMQIVLTQELTNRLLRVLVSKIRLDSNGINAVKNACSRVLNQFVTNGYISTEKAWTDPDLYIDNELVAAENTPLIDGYKIHVSPITEINITEHQIPAVYILYGDQVGVRKIVITGEVF